MNDRHPAELPAHLIAGAGEALSRARDLLLTPDPQNLDIACSSLAIAVARITELRTAMTVSPSRDLVPAVTGLHQEIDLISRLLEHAASYHVNLIQCMIRASGADVPPGPLIESARCLSQDA